MIHGSPGALRHHKYHLLVVMLLGGLVIQSSGTMVAYDGFGHDVLATALGIAIFFVVFDRSPLRRGIAVILVLLVGTGWARHWTGGRYDHALSSAYQALTACYFWLAVFVILRNLFRTAVVGVENVLGAICGYLIAGAAWSSVNAFAYLHVPAAYAFDPKVVPLLAEWHGRVALFSYYSYAQMLTIGYADVTPVRAPATTLSLLAALFGLFYTAVVVAQVVGMAQSGRREPPGDS